MSDADGLVIRILRDIQDRLRRVERKLDGAGERAAIMGSETILMKKDDIRQVEAIAHLQVRRDRLETQIARINTRLGLIDADA